MHPLTDLTELFLFIATVLNLLLQGDTAVVAEEGAGLEGVSIVPHPGASVHGHVVLSWSV